jgi:hypothetical protein
MSDNQHIRELGEQAERSQADFAEEVDRLAMSSTGRTQAQIQHLTEKRERMYLDIRAYRTAVEEGPTNGNLTATSHE